MTFTDFNAGTRRMATFAADTALKAAELYASNTLGVSLIGLGSWALQLQPPRGHARCKA